MQNESLIVNYYRGVALVGFRIHRYTCIITLYTGNQASGTHGHPHWSWTLHNNPRSSSYSIRPSYYYYRTYIYSPIHPPHSGLKFSGGGGTDWEQNVRIPQSSPSN